MSHLTIKMLFNRCSARNLYAKNSKEIQFMLEVTNPLIINNAILLQSLQSQALFIGKGNTLNLHCAPTSIATSKGNIIRWTFSSRSPTSSSIELQSQYPNRLQITNTSIEKNDGIYKCYFGNEYQVCNGRMDE